MESVFKTKYIASSAVADVMQFGVELEYISTYRHDMCLKVTYIEVVIRPL